MKKTIGILALQGSFAEHANILKKLKVKYIFVRTKEELEKTTHLIIPGGESGTIDKLLHTFKMWEMLEKRIKKNDLRIFGTCAGAILCTRLGLNISVTRNGFGAQQDSFVADLQSDLFPNLQGVFIRAPRFTKIKNEVKILAMYNNEPVLVSEKNFLAASFHPEILEETRIHEYFLNNF